MRVHSAPNTFAAVVVLLLSCTQPIDAQSTYSTLLGKVTDQTGHAAPKTTITVRSVDTNITVQRETSESGDFTVTNLTPGIYRLEVSKQGFKTVSIGKIVLYQNATLRHDVVLEIGGVEQRISVEATAPVVSTDSSSLSSVVESRSILALPLNGRVIDQLIATTAGYSGGDPGNPRIGGTPSLTTFFTVDGSPYQDVALGRAAATSNIGLAQFPSVETIQEFKVEGTLAKAEFEGAAAVSIVTKSGTNEFHGSVLWFNRNRAAASKDFFLTGQPKPGFNRNEFGAAVGGPILRDRSFFFANYEGLRLRQATTAALSVATPAMRQGDFSGLAPIRDPLSGLPFPQNRIPQDRIAPAAISLQQFLPPPNQPGADINYIAPVPGPIDQDRAGVRFDHHLNQRHTLNVSYSRSRNRQISGITGFAPYDSTWPKYGRLTRNASLGVTSAFSASVLNEFRYSYFVNMERPTGRSTDFDPNTLFGNLDRPLESGGIPSFSIAGSYGLGYYGVQDCCPPQITNQFTDSVTIIRGSHAIKFGADVGLIRQSRSTVRETPAFGSFTFNGRYTGLGYADFLLGDAVSTARSQPAPNPVLYYTRFAAYIQDDWKVTPRLTLNIGLRYAAQTAPRERDGIETNFDLASGRLVVRSDEGQVTPAAVPRLLNAYPIARSEDVGWGNSLLLTDWLNFGPRVGFAWRPFAGTKTVIRGGYGIYYGYHSHGLGIFGSYFANPPFFLSETYEAPAGETPFLTFSNPFPGMGSIAANPVISAVERQLRQPYSQQWNFTVERELLQSLGMRLSYVGNKGTDLPRYRNNWNRPFTQAPGTIQSRRPVQPWADVNALEFDGLGITHQFQAELTQRFRSGLFFQANYTLDKSIDNAGYGVTPQDPLNKNGERGFSDGIRRNNFTVNLTYELPFGAGKRFANNSRLLNYTLGNWTLGSIWQVRSGTPYSVTFTPTEAGWFATRPNVVAGVDTAPANPSIDGWFNPAAFAVPQPFTFGNASRNLLYGPWQKIFDMSVTKEIPMRERVRLQLRADAFNFPNTVSFGNPSANISFPGQVGRIRSTTVGARTFQFGAKIVF